MMLMSSSPSEMCFRAASVSAVTVLELLELPVGSSEELEGDPAGREGAGDRGGGGGGGGNGEMRGGSSSATDMILHEEKVRFLTLKLIVYYY